MKMSIDLRMNRVLLCFSLICLFSVGAYVPTVSAGALSAPQIKSYRQGQLKTYFGADFFYATQSFDGSGNSGALTSSGDYYYLLEMPLGIRYSFNDSWAFDLAGIFAAAESKTSDITYKATRSNSSLNGVYFGTDFVLMRSPFELIPELDVIYPLEKYDTTTDYVMTSEGVLQATGALRIQHSFGAFLMFGRLGYTYRAEGRSSLLPYSIAGAYDTGSTAFGLAVSGFQSLSTDQDQAKPLLRNTTISRVQGGARKFYSIEPSMVDLSLFLNMEISPRWSLDFNGGYDVAGTSYAQGPHGGMTLTINWDLFQKKGTGSQDISAPLTPESRLSTEKDIQMFKEEVQDGVDQKLFQARPTPIPEPPAQKSPAKNSIQKSNSRPTKEQLQQELDETEMKIKLKRKRR
ncbi:MAG: hypothetical protein JNM39_06230 [Bdellovibrionaceae bacterium]|nr:hypothetical protein [Pseudobdellovibrionaceae bacterium]